VHIRVDALRTAIMSSSASIICVTIEVGMSLIPTDAGSRLFTDLLGYTNAQLAQEMDETFLVVAGRPLRLPTKRATEKPL
jgi:adenosylcobinamide kinase/adenosylcobinamide-phosphate guanylyltransferase